MLRTTLLAVVALATTTFAQGIPGLPTCAQPCVTNYGGCNQVDVKCICSNKPLIANLACCVGNLCDSAGQLSVIQFADSLCKAYDVTDLPTSATCAPGAVSTPFTGTAVGSDATSSTAAPALTTGGAQGAAVASSSSGTAAPQSTGAAVDYKAQGVGMVLGLAGFLAAL